MPMRTTPGLNLRPFTLADAPAVQALACERRVAETTAAIPHPYPPGAAAGWIATHAAAWEARSLLALAMVARADGTVLGAISLQLDLPQASAEMGYWTGLPYWGRGHASEAARAILEIAFEELPLERVHAHHLKKNPASGRVMQKAGMHLEREFSASVRGQDEAIAAYGISRVQWLAAR